MLAFLLCVQDRYWFTTGKVVKGLSSPYSICVCLSTLQAEVQREWLALAQSYGRFWGCHTHPMCECGVHIGSHATELLCHSGQGFVCPQVSGILQSRCVFVSALGEGNFPSCIPGRQAEVLISGETEAAVDMCVDVAWLICDFRNKIIQQLLENKLLMKVTEIWAGKPPRVALSLSMSPPF